jgi:hypothetical protein
MAADRQIALTASVMQSAASGANRSFANVDRFARPRCPQSAKGIVKPNRRDVHPDAVVLICAADQRACRGQRGAAKKDAATAVAFFRFHGRVIAIVVCAYTRLALRTTQRKPTWLVEVSTGSACRAAGR